MTRRRFLPALRGRTESKSLQQTDSGLYVPEQGMQAEEKVITLGYGFSSTTYSGTSSLAGMDRAAGYDLETVIVDGYERVVWVWKAVEFYSNHFSRLPFVIGKKRGTPDEEKLDKHPLYRVLNKRANPLENGRAFRKRLSAQVLLSKRGAFVEVTRSRAGTITRLDLLPPDRVRPVPDPNGDYLLHFEFTERNGNVREIDPERIRWIRDPHPTDPFCGVTPLDPAGASVDLDKKARDYNRSFIDNDARPGGIVGVDADTLTDAEMRRVESRFAPGAHEAGKISVIATGPGGLRYIDTTTRPRDMAYAEMAENAKLEILSAFGLGESLFGQSAGRTYDNAEQDKFNAWTESLVPHFDLIAGAFADDIDDEWDAWIDTSTVEVLELPRRKAREEARAEWTAGLRSANEYRPLADLQPIDNAYARALWISPSKAPVPLLPGDAEALGLGGEAGGDQPAPDGRDILDGQVVPDLALPPGASAAEVVAAAREVGESTAAAAVAEARGDLGPDESTAAGAVEAARDSSMQGGTEGDAALVVAEARERKALDAADDRRPPTAGGPVTIQPSEEEARRVELAAAAALDAVLARQAGVLAARIEAPKTRKGTRFWTPDGPQDTRAGEEPLDLQRAVDAERWATEAVETLQPIVQTGTAGAGAEVLTALAAVGLVVSAPAPTQGAVYVREAGTAATGVTLSVLQKVGEAVLEWLRDMTDHLQVAERTVVDLDALIQESKKYHADRAREFVDAIALMVGQASVNGGREAAVSALTPLPGTEAVGITREWVSQRDDRVRASHRAVDGKAGPVGRPWQVGEALLRFPGDPMGPLEETAGCRCRAWYRVSPRARFILPPVATD